jgi:hypothetical protein
MTRYAVALAIVLGLAVGVWLLWPDDPVSVTPTTVLAVAPSTTGSPTTTGPVPSTPDSSHVVETVEEAEAILRTLWFGWFEGIYNQDEDRIREVVATEEQVATAREQFGVMEFIAAPTPEALAFSDVEILRSDEQCLAAWVVADADAFLGEGAERSSVDVLRWSNGSWLVVRSWANREDLWEDDCESLLSQQSP